MHVHHIRPISDGGAALDLDNLQTLCHACHNTITPRRPRPYKVNPKTGRAIVSA